MSSTNNKSYVSLSLPEVAGEVIREQFLAAVINNPKRAALVMTLISNNLGPTMSNIEFMATAVAVLSVDNLYIDHE